MDPKSVVAIVVLCAGLFACGEMAGPGRGSAVPAHPTLALSLRALEDDIRAAVAAHGAATPVQARLFGLNRIEGFTASPQQDTVLFGSHDHSEFVHPLTHFEGLPRTRAASLTLVVFPEPEGGGPEACGWLDGGVNIAVDAILAVVGHLDNVGGQA